MQEQELFQQYELKGWQLTPRLYKIIVASIMTNLVLFVLMAQANFLTGKTCDSPVASGVCSVIDALYIGSMIAAEDTGFVDKDYVKTELGDAEEEITFVQWAPPLEYPEGYFALANPEQMQPQMIDGFPVTPGAEFPASSVNPTIINPTPDLTTVNPTYPTPGKTTPRDDFPKSPFGTVTSPSTSKSTVTNGKTNKTPKQNDVDTAAVDKDKTTQDQSEPIKLGEINRKPFEDLGDDINAKLEKNEIDLSKNFSIILDGTIRADGTFDPDKTKTRFVRATGDEQMVNAAKQALEAVGVSGFLGMLKVNGIDRVNITLVQDDTQIYAIVVSDQKTAERAASTASGLNTILSAAIIADENNWKKLDDNSRVLVKNSKITSEKNNFILKFALPKQDAQAIINKTLKDRAEKKSKALNSSAEVNNNTNAKSGK